jgi:hypothetical protein
MAYYHAASYKCFYILLLLPVLKTQSNLLRTDTSNRRIQPLHNVLFFECVHGFSLQSSALNAVRFSTSALSCTVVTRPRGDWVRSPVQGIAGERALSIKSKCSRQSDWLE